MGNKIDDSKMRPPKMDPAAEKRLAAEEAAKRAKTKQTGKK